VCLVEWPEKAAGHVPPADLALLFRFPPQASDGERVVELLAGSEAGRKCLSTLQNLRQDAAR
jgi:tRNA threonylcarbamoyladenosine biosynthesis protein TsaE